MIPPKADAEFVAAIEDVPEVYHRPYDEKRPLVCLDEASKQLVGEVADPIAAAPDRPERIDRTAADFAEFVAWLVGDVQ